MEKELLFEYKKELLSYYLLYCLMSILLRDDVVARVIEKNNIKEVYIWGNDSLACQTYNAVKKHVNVKGIVGFKNNYFDDDLMVDMDEIHRDYRNETMIITDIEHADIIENKLTDFCNKECIMVIGDLFKGEI